MTFQPGHTINKGRIPINAGRKKTALTRYKDAIHDISDSIPEILQELLAIALEKVEHTLSCPECGKTIQLQYATTDEKKTKILAGREILDRAVGKAVQPVAVKSEESVNYTITVTTTKAGDNLPLLGDNQGTTEGIIVSEV